MLNCLFTRVCDPDSDLSVGPVRDPSVLSQSSFQEVSTLTLVALQLLDSSVSLRFLLFSAAPKHAIPERFKVAFRVLIALPHRARAS